MEEFGPLSPDQVLEELLDESKPIGDSALADLSDLDREEARSFKARWPGVGVARRRETVARLVELVEDNFDLNFHRVFMAVAEDEDPEVREKAAAGLELTEENSAVPVLVGLLGDRSEPVRVAAAQSLGKFVLLGELDKVRPADVARAREALLSILENRQESPELRRHALEAISPWPSPKVAELIGSAYRSDEPESKESALYAMGMNCDPRWLPIVYSELKCGDPRMRYEAAHAAGEIGEAEAAPRLLPLLRDEDVEVRLQAIWALGQVGGKVAKQALKALAAEGDEGLRGAIEDALQELANAEGGFVS